MANWKPSPHESRSRSPSPVANDAGRSSRWVDSEYQHGVFPVVPVQVWTPVVLTPVGLQVWAPVAIGCCIMTPVTGGITRSNIYDHGVVDEQFNCSHLGNSVDNENHAQQQLKLQAKVEYYDEKQRKWLPGKYQGHQGVDTKRGGGNLLVRPEAKKKKDRKSVSVHPNNVRRAPPKRYTGNVRETERLCLHIKFSREWNLPNKNEHPDEFKNRIINEIKHDLRGYDPVYVWPRFKRNGNGTIIGMLGYAFVFFKTPEQAQSVLAADRRDWTPKHQGS